LAIFVKHYKRAILEGRKMTRITITITVGSINENGREMLEGVLEGLLEDIENDGETTGKVTHRVRYETVKAEAPLRGAKSRRIIPFRKAE
jgi:hypothetical protein